MLKRSVQMGLLALAAMMMLSFTSASASAQPPVIFEVDRVLDFQVIQGNQLAVNRVLQSYFIFDTQRGGFYFYPLEYIRWDMPPLSGYYRVEGSQVRFQASISSNLITGGTNSAVEGEIDFSSGQPVVAMRWTSASIMAAVVNGSRFGANSQAAYRLSAVLNRVM